MIDPTQVYIEIFRRVEGNKWLLETYNDIAGTCALYALGLEIPIATIYNKVEWSDA